MENTGNKMQRGGPPKGGELHEGRANTKTQPLDGFAPGGEPGNDYVTSAKPDGGDAAAKALGEFGSLSGGKISKSCSSGAAVDLPTEGYKSTANAKV